MKDFEQVREFRHLILFAKGCYDVPDSEYWPTLKKICDNYLGHSASSIIGLYEMSNKARHALYGDTITIERFNDELLEYYQRETIIRQYTATPSENLTPIQYMIRANLSFLARATRNHFGSPEILGKPDLNLKEN